MMKALFKATKFAIFFGFQKYAALLFCPFAFAQVNIDFEQPLSASWKQTEQIVWERATDQAIDQNYSLRHGFDGDVTGADAIIFLHDVLYPNLDETRWSFRLRHGHQPSGSNHWAVFLSAYVPVQNLYPDSVANAWLIGVNVFDTDDVLKLFKVVDGQPLEVINTGINWQDSIGTEDAPLIEITRSVQGQWNVKLSASGLQNDLYLTGTANDTTGFSSAYFGIYYAYTANYDQLLWFDNLQIDGHFIPDINPPTVSDARFISARTLKIVFDAHVIANAPLNDVFTTTIENEILSIDQHQESFYLHFEKPVQTSFSFEVMINGISDLSGNLMEPTSVFPLSYSEKAYDLLITEIMADPSPAVQLPEAEYIEITNTSSQTLNLYNHQLWINNKRLNLPEYSIAPEGRVIVTGPNDGTSYPDSLSAIALNDFPALPNDGATIALLADGTFVMHALAYSNDWYGQTAKKDGGWSLEMIDASNPCAGAHNWLASNHPQGGTPGAVNSVNGQYPDNLPPSGWQIGMPDSATVRVYFSESIDTASFNLSSTSFSNGLDVQAYRFDFPLQRYVDLYLNKTLSPSQAYSMILQPGLLDCAGNRQKVEKAFAFKKPDEVKAGNIVFNEVMIAPTNGQYEYIELYNASENYLALDEIWLATINAVDLELKSYAPISTLPFLFSPGQYIVMAKDTGWFNNHFYTCPQSWKHHFEVPSLNNDEGILTLFNALGDTIDKLHYSEKWHSPWVINSDGVALERLNPSWPSYQADNWSSGITADNYGTPGCTNSNFTEIPETAANCIVQPQLFTPNGDGYHDEAIFNFSLPPSNYQMHVSVYTINGQLIKNVKQNELTNGAGMFSWDGRNQNGLLCPIGIYLVHIECISNEGKVYEFRKTCVLGKNVR